MPKLRAFPLVDKEGSMILLGSVTKRRLWYMLEDLVGPTARMTEAARRYSPVRSRKRPSIIPSECPVFFPVSPPAIKTAGDESPERKESRCAKTTHVTPT
jgi:hypothetical protein